MKRSTKSSPYDHDPAPRVQSRAMPKSSLRFLRAAPLLCLLMAGPFACSETMSAGVATSLDAGSGGLFAPEAGDGTIMPDASSAVGLCASNACPAGRVTCPNAPFPCGVDLSSDDQNCGACGVRCPNDETFLRAFSGIMRCVAGTCRLVCDEEHGDCNGLPEDGCETLIRGDKAKDIKNCGACGNVCSDICFEGVCGCPPGQTFCDDGKCHDLDADNRSCGACGNVCPPSTEPPFPPSWHAIRMCKDGECNKPLCLSNPFIQWRDCNGDFPDDRGGDGCETRVDSDVDNCGGCGIKCGPGEVCALGLCTCTCGAVCFKGLDSDPRNCGTCGLKCPGDWSTVSYAGAFSIDPAHGAPVCDQGVCGYTCSPYWADCDADISNGCETDLRNDPLNCGACGLRCDGIEGQPCVEGRCLTKECDVK